MQPAHHANRTPARATSDFDKNSMDPSPHEDEDKFHGRTHLPARRRS